MDFAHSSVAVRGTNPSGVFYRFSKLKKHFSISLFFRVQKGRRSWVVAEPLCGYHLPRQARIVLFFDFSPALCIRVYGQRLVHSLSQCWFYKPTLLLASLSRTLSWPGIFFLLSAADFPFPPWDRIGRRCKKFHLVSLPPCQANCNKFFRLL